MSRLSLYHTTELLCVSRGPEALESADADELAP